MSSVAAAADRLVQPGLFVDGRSLAVHVSQSGRVLAETYGPGVSSDATLISWSMAKTITGVLVGLAIDDGLLDLSAPAPVPEWADDERSAITLRHLLQMRSGLDFVEDYVDAGVSHCIEMLFGDGQTDVGGYAAARPAAHPPGEVWNYSSGETNIICRLLRDVLGGGAPFQEWAHRRLLDPLGLSSMTLRADDAGTFIGSSFAYATAADFARFGRFLLDGGRVGSTPLLAADFVTEMTTVHATDPETGQGYGLQTWTTPDGRGTFSCNGYEGQYILCVPSIGTVIVHLGKVPIEERDVLRTALDGIIEAIEAGG